MCVQRVEDPVCARCMLSVRYVRYMAPVECAPRMNLTRPSGRAERSIAKVSSTVSVMTSLGELVRPRRRAGWADGAHMRAAVRGMVQLLPHALVRARTEGEG